MPPTTAAAKRSTGRWRRVGGRILDVGVVSTGLAALLWLIRSSESSIDGRSRGCGAFGAIALTPVGGPSTPVMGSKMIAAAQASRIVTEGAFVCLDFIRAQK